MIKYRVKILIGSMFGDDKKWVYLRNGNIDAITEHKEHAKKFTQDEKDDLLRKNPGITVMCFPFVESKTLEISVSKLQRWVDMLSLDGSGTKVLVKNEILEEIK